MADVKPIFGIDANKIKQLQPIMDKLPNDPKEIAVIAQSNGFNFKRIACCVKLLKIFYSSIPKFSISGKEKICIDPSNEKFEDELTVSKRCDPKTLTGIFTCCLISIGPDCIRHYEKSMNSPNPFVQCLRILFRIMWFLRVRKHLLYDLSVQNKLGMLNNAIRLASFRDFCPSAMRSAIFCASSYPSKVNLRLFAYMVPKRYLTDSIRTMYDDFKTMLSTERQDNLFDLEINVDQILKSKLNPTHFSARTSLEDSLLYSFPLEELYEDIYDDMMSGYLFELCPDKEIERFRRDFIKAAERASSVRLENVQRHFNITPIPGVFIPPKDYVPDEKEETVEIETKKDANFNMFNMFKTSHNFIDETRNMYKKKKL